MNRDEIAVLVPSYNEESALPKTIEELASHFTKNQIIIINDGSIDNTKQVAKESGVVLINLPLNMGIGVAMQTGYRYALRNGFKFAVQCDGDGQHRPEEIESLCKKIEEENVEMVVGSRFVDDSVSGFKSFFVRRMAIRYLSTLIKIFTGIRTYDVTSGFRAVDHKVIKLFAGKYPFDYPEPESLVLINNHGFKVIETAVSMRERQGGVSSIGFFAGIYYMVKVTMGIAVTKLRGVR